MRIIADIYYSMMEDKRSREKKSFLNHKDFFLSFYFQCFSLDSGKIVIKGEQCI
jgi:hypothetical protein